MLHFSLTGVVLKGLLWHYADGTALKSIIENRVFWASSPGFMNDLNELLSGSQLLQEVFREEKGKLEADEVVKLEQLISGNGLRANRFILSACADGDSLTMWRAYGRAAVSYAIAIDASVPLRPRAQSSDDTHPNPSKTYYSELEDVAADGTPFMLYNPDQTFFDGSEWQSVVYDEAAQKQMVLEVFESLKTSVKKEIDSKARGESRIFMHQWFALDSLYHIKHHGFQDEQESRILTEVHPSWKFVLYRPGPFGLVPYVELGIPQKNEFAPDGKQKMDLLPIRSISIGPTPYRDEAKASLQQFLDFYGYHDVEVYTSEIPYRN